MGMKQILVILAAVILVGCGKEEQAKATPDASANKLFVEAVQLITSAEEQTGEAAIKDYEQALGKLGEIIANYSESDLAVKLISGETLFTGKSLEEIQERVKELKRVAAESVVATSPVIVRRDEARFNDGELTEAELEEITSLSYDVFTITDAGLKDIAKLKNLTHLGLSFNKVTDADLKEVAKLQKLEYLNLGNTQITDAGLREVAKLQKLEELGLEGTQITDAGLKEVPKLQNLDELYLSRTQITDAGLKEVAKLQKLTELYLYSTQITEAGIAELKKALPDCEIVGP